MTPATSRPVPVTLGSPKFQTVQAGRFRVTEAWFPPGLRLDPHVHDRTSVAVMLQGGFGLTILGRSLACEAATVFTEPAGERHGNRVEGTGARVVVVQPDPEDDELRRTCADVLGEVRLFQHAEIHRAAWRLAGEIQDPDAVSPLAIESLALETLAAASRRLRPRLATNGPPAWLRRAREMVQARCLEELTAAEIAASVGVHPVHLARVFRKHYRQSIGACVRTLRLEWAALRLAQGEEALSDIALAAGFADQSHFTRAFRRHAGMTPDRYRKTARG
jgi:AraC family transcriptional regulator